MSDNVSPSPSERGLIYKLSKVVEAIASAAIVLMVVLVILEVLLRTTIGFSFGFADELVSYLVVLITFFGVTITFRDNALFKVELFYKSLSKKGRRVLDFIHSVLSVGLCSLLIYYAFFLIKSSYSRGTISQTKLETPLYIPQLMIPVGLIVLVIFLIDFVRRSCFTAGSDDTAQAKE
jgi:TRAP-type C4-dicarboxylate transport system permease small subunit